MITQNWTRFTDKDCYLSMVGIMIGFNHVFGIVLQVLSSYNGTHRLTGIAWLLCPCYYHVVQSLHYNDVIMGAIASEITSLTIIYSTETGEFPAQMASNAENVSIWWRHHEFRKRESNIRVIDLQMSPRYLNCSAMCDTCIEATHYLSMPA